MSLDKYLKLKLNEIRLIGICIPAILCLGIMKNQ